MWDVESVYGNPSPYANPELERHMLEGRISAARKILTAFEKDGDGETAARWRRITDELLDHLAEVDARANTAALEKA